MKYFIYLTVFLLCSTAISQIKFDDPLTVIKDSEGKVLSREDVKKIMDCGNRFSLSPSKSGDTTIYLLKIISIEEVVKSDSSREAGRKALVNKLIKPFTLKTLNGKTVSQESIKGKVTVMNFWFTGCKPCIREMPELNKLVDKFGDQVNFYAPTFDSFERTEKFLDKREFKYESLPESKPLNESLGIKVYPTHLIIDEEGIVWDVIFGASENIGEALAEKIQNLLE